MLHPMGTHLKYLNMVFHKDQSSNHNKNQVLNASVIDSIMDHFHILKKYNNLLLHRFITQSKIMKSQKLWNPIKTTIVLMNKSINYLKFSSSRFSLNYTIHKRDENSSSCSSWDQSHCQWILVAIAIWSLKTSACTLWLLCEYFHDKFLLGDN